MMKRTYEGVRMPGGEELFTAEYVESLREADARKANPYTIIAQRGGQENMLRSRADITIGGGCRGGSKSFSLLLDDLKDVYNPRFRSVILRDGKDDLSDLIETSKEIFTEFGEYNKSKDYMQWNFHAGGFLSFTFHGGNIDDFKKRFRGKQFAYIGVDEVTQISYEKFQFLLTCNRNAAGIRNRFFGTCNPDPDSWVAKFIEWWIGEDGLPIKERDGVLRYCFMDGDTPETVIWGDSKEEVYEQCRDIIDRLWRPEFAEFGSPADLFVKSVTFIEAKLADNKKLLKSDPTYLSNLANQSAEQRARDLDGNWKYRSVGNDLIKLQDMENFYGNAEQRGDGVRRASCDVAFEGGDNLVMWMMEGCHVRDIFVCKMDSRRVVTAVRAKLTEWGVKDENFTYDMNGIGQIFKGYFPKAYAFNNNASAGDGFKDIYANMKTRAAYVFRDKLVNGELSINGELLTRRYSGKGFTDVPLRQILNTERKAVMWQSGSERGYALIKKEVMKRLVGHSPDFVEGLIMMMVFFFVSRAHRRPKGMLRFVDGGRRDAVRYTNVRNYGYV